MKKIYIYIILLFCSLIAVSCEKSQGALPAEKGEPGRYMDTYTESLWELVNANAAGLDIFNICEFVIEASHLGWDQKYIKVALDNLAAAQIRDESHEAYGQIPRTIGSEPNDPNNAHFLLELLNLVRMHYYDTLSDENKTTLDEIIDYSIYAIMHDDNVAITYTNIYLMRAWNLIALGETLPSDRTWGGSYTPYQLKNEGYNMVRAWMAEIKANGIHEHNSPTYTGVQAECLGYIAKYTKDDDIRHEAQVALEYFSAMLFANYYTPSMCLGGVQSRCAYKGSSNGKIDRLAASLIKGYGTYWYNKMAMWEPTAEAREINATYPRLVNYKWGADPDMNAVSYYTEKYNISSVGRPYTGNANEKTMTVFLTSPEHKNPVNVVHYLDGRQDPYGKSKVGSYARHLQKYALGRSQRNNEFVAYVSGDGSERGDTKKLQSHIVLPSNFIDEVWNGDKKIENWLGIGSQALSSDGNYTFFLKFEDVVVSIRYLMAKDIDGKDVKPGLYIDSDGTQSFANGNAMRLTADLSSATPAKWQRGTVAMWWRADDGIDTEEKFAALRSKVINAPVEVSDDGSKVKVLVTTPDGDLGFEGDLIRKKFPQAVFAYPTAAQEAENNREYWGFSQTSTIGGVEAEKNHFTVNGKDISGPIFAKSNL